jgi:cell division protein FtsB
MKSKFFFHVFLFGFTFSTFIYISYIGIKNVFRYNAFKRDYEQVVDKLGLLAQKNTQYKQKLLSMGQNKFWEKEAKLKLGFVKQGEEIYRLVDIKKED